MSIVDAWMQHPTRRFLRHDMFQPLWRWTGQVPPDEEVPLSRTLELMDEAGVQRGLICAWYDATGPLISNDEVASFVQAAPDRLTGVASVDLRDPIAAVHELRRAVNELGFCALRIIPWLWGLPPNHRLYYPLYAECVELGIPFLTQVGHTGPMRTSETGRPIPYLDDVALEFPDLTIVGGHIGYPWTQEMIALATKYPNVHIDTSAYTVRRYPPELVDYMRGHGRTKVLFGSNYPMITPEQALQGLAELKLDDEATELFLAGNATRVFALSGGRAA
jgi:predicted TIM-barrel fold metal-dependent hydrolase